MEKEVREAVASILAAIPTGEEAKAEDEVDLDESVVGRGRRIRRLSSSSSESSIVVPLGKPLATSSVKGGVRTQGIRWDIDSEVAKVSQEEAYKTLVIRHRTLEANHERLLKERDGLEGTVRQLRRHKTECEEALIGK